MLPTLAIIGRPNVGKSTLFNRLTQTRQALVADIPGLTRDRQYGEAVWSDQRMIVIDTGGLGEATEDVENLMEAQALLAIEEADVILFMVDARAGLTGGDHEIIEHVRPYQEKVFVVVNKIDGCDEALVCADFFQLGLEQVFGISAAYNRGMKALMAAVISQFPEQVDEQAEKEGIKIAFIGRPNVGKSTLVNRMLGEDRMIVFDAPGTTRDSVLTTFERRGRPYTLIDTAGIRRRSKVAETIEKFSVVKALQAIEMADVVLTIFNAQEGISEQDIKLLGFVLHSGRSLVIVINKWDGLTIKEREGVKESLERRLAFIDYARRHFISALHGTGVGELYTSIEEAYRGAIRSIATSKLTEFLSEAVTVHQPPSVHGRRIKCRYAHMGGHRPPLLVIHGKQVESLPDSYQRYLVNTFRKKFGLMGTPIRLQLKNDTNPFEGKKNVLTVSQQRKRKRLMQFVKKKKR